MAKIAKKKREGWVEGLCLLCWKPPTKTDKVASENKDFVCSHCTQYLLEHPRKCGESFEDVLDNISSKKDCEVKDEATGENL